MFEKEAEEYGKRISKGLTIEKGSNAEIALKSGILGFECGAEFGYQKGFEFGVKSNEKVNKIVANEWQNPKLNGCCILPLEKFEEDN